MNAHLPSMRRLRTAFGLLLVVVLAGAGGGLLLATPSAAQPEAPTLNWAQVHNAPGIYWYTVVFPTPLVGYALGGPDWNVNEGIGPATLAKTTDGGQTWTNIPVPNTNRFMRGLACIDANRCWVIGASSPRIRYTQDGGATWASGTIVNNVWSGWLWSAGYSGVGTTLFAGTTGYAAEPGRMANLLRSADGANFSAVVANDPREFVIYDFSCPSPGVCYTAAKQSSFYTADNGATLTPPRGAFRPLLRRLVHEQQHLLVWPAAATARPTTWSTSTAPPTAGPTGNWPARRPSPAGRGCGTCKWWTASTATPSAVPTRLTAYWKSAPARACCCAPTTA